MTHKDFGHALTHVHKAGGKLAAMVDDMDHSVDAAEALDAEAVGNMLADLVICALRMANTAPGGNIDLQRAVVRRLALKNGIELEDLIGKLEGP